MKNNILKRILWVLIGTILIIAISGCGKDNVIRNTYEVQHKNQDIIGKEDAKKDLEYIKNIIEEVHPKPYGSLTKEEYDKRYKDILSNVKEDISYEDMCILAQKLISVTGDMNSTVRFNTSNEELPIDLDMSLKGIWAINDYENIKSGDTVKYIGNKTIEQLAEKLKSLFPMENKYSIIGKMPELLDDGRVLRYLGLVNEKKGIKIETISANGEDMVHYLKLQNREKEKKVTLKNIYKIKDNIGMLKIHDLNIDEKEKEQIGEFFKDIHKNKISNIAIDFRNSVGNQEVFIRELLKYLGINELKNYTMEINESEIAKEQHITQGQDIYKKKIKVKKARDIELYNGKVYVMTSYDTCKMAIEIATILRDNHIAKILGTYSIYSPNRFGNELEFQGLGSKVIFTVSTSKITRPNQNVGDVLSPDNYVIRGYSPNYNNDQYMVELENCIAKERENKLDKS